jgi:hypothetical protein
MRWHSFRPPKGEQEAGCKKKQESAGGIVKLDYHIFKSALNGFFGMFVGVKQRPTFFDVQATCPALDRVTEAYPAIRKNSTV